MSDHVNFLKPDPVACPCGCGTVARPRAKAWGDGLYHARGCPCRRCVGGRQVGKARRREHKVAKATGGTREPMSGNLSGIDGKAGLWTWEETANEAVVRGLRRWWTSKTVQTKTARMMSRHGEAHALICSWDGRPQVVVVPFADWAGQVLAEMEAL